MTAKEFQMMNAALPRCRSYGPELTENEQVIVLQGERIRNLEDALREAMCPSAMIDNKDETVGYCVEHQQCGCGMQAMGLCSVPQRGSKP